MRECVWSPQHSVCHSTAILRPVDCFHPAWYSFLRLFIVRLVMCLLPYLPNETGGSPRQDAYFLFPYDLYRKWRSVLCTGAHSKGSFLSLLFFSIFQSSKYWPSFPDPSTSSRHPVTHIISLKYFFSENSSKSVVLSLFYRRRNGSEEPRNLPKFQWFRVVRAVFHRQGVKL